MRHNLCAQEQVIWGVCRKYKIHRQRVVTKWPSKTGRFAKRGFMYRLHTEMGFSYPTIASILRLKSHATVWYGVREYRRLRQI